MEGGRLRSGAVMHGVVTLRLGYRILVDLELAACRRPVAIDAVVHGDMDGNASAGAPGEQTVPSRTIRDGLAFEPIHARVCHYRGRSHGSLLGLPDPPLVVPPSLDDLVLGVEDVEAGLLVAPLRGGCVFLGRHCVQRKAWRNSIPRRAARIDSPREVVTRATGTRRPSPLPRLVSTPPPGAHASPDHPRSRDKGKKCHHVTSTS